MTLPQLTVVGNGVQQVGIKGRASIEVKNSNTTKYIGAFNYYDNNVAEAAYDNNGRIVENDKSMNLSKRAYDAFTALIGSDNIFDLKDLDNVDTIAKKFDLNVDKTKIDKGEIVLNFKSGESIHVDFMTQDEITEYNEKTSDPISKAAGTVVSTIAEGAEWTKENILKPVGKWFADKFDTALDRIESWQKTP